jgi:hypothetical protein
VVGDQHPDAPRTARTSMLVILTSGRKLGGEKEQDGSEKGGHERS